MTSNAPAISFDPTPRSSPSSEVGGRIRVCHLSMTLKTGGLERLLVDYGRLTDRSLFDVCYIALEELGPPAEDIFQSGWPVESLQFRSRGKWNSIRRLRDLFCKRRIDILHCHNTYPQFYGSIAAAWAGVPVTIATQHGRGCGANRQAVRQFRIANWLTTRVFGVSQDSARQCQEQDPWHAKSIGCVRNGIDLGKFAFHGPNMRPAAISVARLSPEKDVATLIQAVAIVVQQCPDFRLLLVGDGIERLYLEQLAAELGVQSHIDFLGERRDIPHLLKQAGFFVASSKTEGISLTLLEAMAVGLPIVCTAVGGNPETVEDGVTGTLVPPAQPEQLAQAMLHMLNNRDAWPSMAEAARRRAELHFDIRLATERYQTLYQELLVGKRRLL